MTGVHQRLAPALKPAGEGSPRWHRKELRTLNWYEMLEVFGMFLILLSIGWELFFVTTLDSIEKNIHLHRFLYKLDQLHYRQFQLQKHIECKLEELKSGLPSHGDPLSDKWNHDAIEESVERVAKQAENFRRFRIALFIIGSVLVLISKAYTYSDKSALASKNKSSATTPKGEIATSQVAPPNHVGLANRSSIGRPSSVKVKR